MSVGWYCLCFAVFICSVLIGYKFWKIFLMRWRLYRLGVPRIRHFPLLGDVLEMLKLFGAAPGVPRSVYIFQYFFGLKKILKNEDFVWISLGPFSYVVLLSPEAVEVLLSSNREVNKSEMYVVLKPFFEEGLFSSPAEKWRRQRKIINPAFHLQILDQYISVMQTGAEQITNKMMSDVGKPYVDPAPYMTYGTFDIFLRTALKMDLSYFQNKSAEILYILQTSKKMAFKRFFTPVMLNHFIYSLSPNGRLTEKNMNFIETLVKEAINRKRKELKETEDSTNNSEEFGEFTRINRRSFADILLDNNHSQGQKNFTDSEVRDHLMTFVVAGLDTNSSTLISAIYLVGLYPEVQVKVHEELFGIFGNDKDRNVTTQDLKEMHYLTRVIKETLRLYSPVSLISRSLQEELTIKNTTFPKGLTLVILPWVMHMDPVHFPNPDVFDPDRFLANDWHPFSYIPFSAGPRNCIGQAFAMQELKIILATVFRKFKVTSLQPRDEVLVCPEIISEPHKPIKMKVELRP